jgi:HTH-type transcriptional regulator/antitoxin HigA
MNIKLIKNEADYLIALDRLELLFNAKSGSIESDEADILGLMIEDYERRYYPIEAIKIRMEEMELRQIDLVGIIGGKSRVSEVLNKKKKLTLEMIRNITQKLNLSPELLIHDYKLSS